MNLPVIRFQNVRKAFPIDKNLRNQESYKNQEKVNVKKFIAFEDATFSINQGEVIGIIGPNGAGKSTLLRLVAGIYKQDSGEIHVRGSVAALLEIGTGFNRELNAIENIVSYGMLLGMKKSQIESKIQKILDFTELNNFKKMKLKNFSSGMRAKLAYATAVEVNPDILLIDEILSVGDLTFRKKGIEIFRQFKKRRKTIVFTSHNLNLIKNMSDRVMLINNKKIFKIGKPEEVIQVYKEIMKDT